MIFSKLICASLLTTLALLLSAANVNADLSLDFATDTDNDGTPDTITDTVNGAIFSFADAGGGTGNIQTFVQIQGPNNNPNDPRIERGYNTTANNVLDSQNTDQFNHDVLLSEVPFVTIAGTRYFEFLLDVNENAGVGNEGDEFISLDTLQIYTTDVGGQSIDPTIANFSNGVLRYDLDTDVDDNEVLLDFSLNSGSGSIDMTVLVPVWAGANPSDFLILYSEFGAKGTVTFNGESANFSYSNGFEEWAKRTEGIQTIPEPGLLGFLTTVVVALGLRRRKQK